MGDRYYKLSQVLQSETEIYYKVGKYYKCDMKLLQIVTGITSCYNYYKVRVNKM